MAPPPFTHLSSLSFLPLCASLRCKKEKLIWERSEHECQKDVPPPSKGGVATSYGDTELRKICPVPSRSPWERGSPWCSRRTCLMSSTCSVSQAWHTRWSLISQPVKYEDKTLTPSLHRLDQVCVLSARTARMTSLLAL